MQLLADKESSAAVAVAAADAEVVAHRDTVVSSRKEVTITETALQVLTRKLEEAEQGPSEQDEAALVEEHRSSQAAYQEARGARSNMSSRSGRDTALMAAKKVSVRGGGRDISCPAP